MPAGRAAQPRGRGERDTPPARRSVRARRDAPGRTGPAKKAPPRRPARTRSSTGGAFKLSSTRRAAVLALLVCVMALSVAVPLRTYLSQRDELAAQQHQQKVLETQVRELEQRRAELSDPKQIEAEARARLGYVKPGETPYIVEVPEKPAPPPPTESDADGVPWYEKLWHSVVGKES
jgi:cell division protein FtsB